MNALIRSQKNLIAGRFGSKNFYHQPVSVLHDGRRDLLQRSNRSKKHSIDNVCLKPSLRYVIECGRPSLSEGLSALASLQLNRSLQSLDLPMGLLTYRHFSTSAIRWEQTSSKVEATVNTMKNKQKEKEEALQKELAFGPTAETKPEVVVVKKPLRTRIWEELVHYYHGFRLLFIDINICRKLLLRVLMGKKLTRREHRLLVRTTSDLFRLVPFSVFIIVPFMEFLLPVFIKFFPGMLPSTFQTAKDREDKLKQSLQVKLEMAKFLQLTLDEMAVHHKDHKSEEAQDFSTFFRKIKDPAEYVPNEEIIKFSKQFEDEVTLDSLSREQLIAMCRILELNTIGTNNFLRFLLRMKLRNIAADDRLIQKEGLDSLNMYELQQACKTRGMRAYGLSKEKLSNELKEWIDLSVEKVPPILLLLSRAFMVPDDTSATEKLKATISALPETVATQTKAAIGEREGKIDNKTKIEIIKEEERRIKQELEEEKEEEQEKQQQKEQKERDAAEILLDKAPIINIETVVPVKAVTAEDDGLSSKDAEVLGAALENLSKDRKQLLVEKEAIKELKEEIEEYKEDVEELRETTNYNKEQVEESRAAKILFKKVNKMINRLDTVMNTLEKKDESLRKDIEGVEDPEAEAYAKKQDELVHVDELLIAIKQLQEVADEPRIASIQKALSKIDVDKDGQIKVDDVLRVIETIGHNNVKLSENQLEELVTLLEKEEMIESEEKIEKAIAKSVKETAALKSAAAEELVDKAATICDNPDENFKSEPHDEKNDILKKSDKKSDENILKDSRVFDASAFAEAVEKQNEKILPTSTSSALPSPPPTLPTTKPGQPKDKML